MAVRAVRRMGDVLRGSPRGLIEAAELAIPGEADVTIVIDQLEELFTLTDDETERTDFLECVRVAWVDPDSRVRVIATLRADFYDRPLVYPRFGRLLASRTETVAPLQPDELEQAIRGPAERAGVHPRAGPRRGDDRGRRTPAGRAAADPVHVDGAVRSPSRRRYDAARPTASWAASWGRYRRARTRRCGAAEPDERHAIRQVFLRLVALGEGRPDTRRRVARSTLDSLTSSPRRSTGSWTRSAVCGS